MRVLISSSTFPIRLDDGLPRFVFDLAQELTHDCSVLVLAPGASGALARESFGAVDVRRFTYFLPKSSQRLAYGHGMRSNLWSWRSRIQVPPYLLKLAATTRATVRNWRPDVINSHWLVPHGLATALAGAAGSPVPHVLSVHAGDVYLLGRLRAGRALARFVVSRSSAILADGSHVRDALDTILGRASGAVVQPMGVDLELFAPPATPPNEEPRREEYLLFVGRLVEKKGLDCLLRALPHVLDRHPSLRLLVVGDGPLADAHRRLAGRLGIERSVSFLGQKSHYEVANYLRHCRVAVVPSIVDRNGETEGMPTVVVEAMAAGARVVASAVDGIPDVLRHRDNGWLCPPADAQALAATVLEALSPEGVIVARAARSSAAAYSWPRVAARYRAVFSEVDGGGPAASRPHR